MMGWSGGHFPCQSLPATLPVPWSPPWLCSLVLVVGWVTHHQSGIIRRITLARFIYRLVMNGSSIGTHTAGRPVAGLPGMGSASRRRKKPAPVKKATKPTAVGATKAIEKKKATSRSVKPASKWRDWQVRGGASDHSSMNS